MPVPPPILFEDGVLEKCAYFRRVGFWLGARAPNPRPWLQNFRDPQDRTLAVYLLNSFQFLSETVCHQMFIHAFEAIPRLILQRRAGDRPSAQLDWAKFQKRVLITHVEGERASLTSSGHHYDRLARDLLDISPEQIVPLHDALEGALDGRPVVFVDDFIGSGAQLIETWKKRTSIRRSFYDFTVPNPTLEAYYCPLIATEAGMAEVQSECRGLTILPLHVLGNDYNVLEPESSVWPLELRDAGIAMIKRVATASGINLYGFGGLSLALAFHNSTPDATLPLFHHESNQWEPLIRR